MTFAAVPFVARTSRFEMYRMIREDPVPYPENIEVSKSLLELLGLLLEKDPSKRITLSEVGATRMLEALYVLYSATSQLYSLSALGR